jgi:hypothetical protein
MIEKSLDGALVAQPAALNWRPASRAGSLQAFRMGRLVFVPSIVIRQRISPELPH